jgi:hypothetical protein
MLNGCLAVVVFYSPMSVRDSLPRRHVRSYVSAIGASLASSRWRTCSLLLLLLMFKVTRCLWRMGGMLLCCRIHCLNFVPTVGISMRDLRVYPPGVVLRVSIHSTCCDTRYPRCRSGYMFRSGSGYDFGHPRVHPCSCLDMSDIGSCSLSHIFCSFEMAIFYIYASQSKC